MIWTWLAQLLIADVSKHSLKILKAVQLLRKMGQMELQINKVLTLDKRKISAPTKKLLVPKVSAKIMQVKIKAKTKVRIKLKTRAQTKALIRLKTKVQNKDQMRQQDLKLIDLIRTTRQLVYLKEVKRSAILPFASLGISKLQ